MQLPTDEQIQRLFAKFDEKGNELREIPLLSGKKHYIKKKNIFNLLENFLNIKKNSCFIVQEQLKLTYHVFQ